MAQESDGEGEDGIQSIKTVASGGALRYIGKVTNLLIGLAVQIVMARFLITASYGSVTLSIAVLGVSLRLGLMGIGSGVSRLFPIHEDDPSKARGVVRAAYRLTTLSAIGIAVGLFVAAPVLAESVFNDPRMVRLIRIVAVFLPFTILAEVSMSIARAARDARPKVFIDEIFRPVLRLALIAVLIYAGLEAVGAIAGHMIAYMITGLLLLIYVLRNLPSWEAPPVSMDQELLLYSLPLLLTGSLAFLMHNVDTFMIGYFLASEKVGIYNVAYQLGTFAIFFLSAGAYVLPPMLAKLDSDGKTYQMDNLYRTITKWIMLVSAPIILVLLVYSSEFIALLFGPRYVGGEGALRILVLGTFASIVLGHAGSSLTSLGKNKVVLYTVTASIIVNICLNYTLIPVYGILGAGIATATSTVVNALLNAAVLFATHRLFPLGWLGIRTMAISGAVAGLLYVVAIGSPLPTLLAGVVWLLVHGVAIVLTGTNQRDKEIFVSVENRLGFQVPLVRRVSSLRRHE